jgi:hypothetical protein
MPRAARIILACLCIWFSGLADGTRQSAAQAARRVLQFADIPADFHAWLKGQGITAATFDNFVAGINRETAERELKGEYEHLIYYALQSTHFTRLPKQEPALSARDFAQSLTGTERARWLDDKTVYVPALDRLPKPATARLKEFGQVLQQPTEDERLRYFQQFTKQHEPDPAKLLAALCREYAAAMRFLYRKEFSQPDASAEQVAALYQTRGHSTDTQIEANFTVRQALAIIKDSQPKAELNRVLIVGPGLDFAPRTDLLDLFGPQSYQPFAVADALLSLGLADEKRLRIHCVDINERVIAHLQSLSRRASHQLFLLSGIADKPGLPLTEDYKRYFQTLGNAVGQSAPLAVPAELAPRLHKSVNVRPALLSHFSADRLNIITERYEPSPDYDLIVVTNVFPYFSDVELLSGLTNLTKMLAQNGYLVHNEARVTAPAVTQPLGLPVLQSRTVLLAAPSAGGRAMPLYDFAGIHQKQSRLTNK